MSLYALPGSDGSETHSSSRAQTRSQHFNKEHTSQSNFHTTGHYSLLFTLRLH